MDKRDSHTLRHYTSDTPKWPNIAMVFEVTVFTTTTPTIPKHVPKVSEKARAALEDKQILVMCSIPKDS